MLWCYNQVEKFIKTVKERVTLHFRTEREKRLLGVSLRRLSEDHSGVARRNDSKRRRTPCVKGKASKNQGGTEHLCALGKSVGVRFFRGFFCLKNHR